MVILTLEEIKNKYQEITKMNRLVNLKEYSKFSKNVMGITKNLKETSRIKKDNHSNLQNFFRYSVFKVLYHCLDIFFVY